MNKGLWLDLCVVLVIISLAPAISFKFNVRPLVSAVFFFILPSLYLFLCNPRPLKRILLASLLFGTIFAFPFDFLSLFNKAWSEPTEQLVFKIKILNVMPIDHFIWFFFWVFLIVVFYEHFIERDKSDKISANYYKYGILPMAVATAGMLLAFFIKPTLLSLDYAYLFLGFLTLIPFVFLTFRRPVLLSKFLKVAPFFFFLYFLFELTALKLGQWNYPGRYIGQVNFFGVVFPFEEFFFWILMSSTIILSYYELYVDDMR